MDIVSHRKIFYAFSGILFLASLAALAVFGLKLGIDFTGGSLLEVEFSDTRPGVDEIREALEPLALGAMIVQPTGEHGAIMRFRHIDEPTHQEVLRRLSALTRSSDFSPDTLHLAPVAERRFDTIGPTIGRELARKSLWAIILVIVLIVSYIAWAFRKVSTPAVSRVEQPVQSWKYGLTTVVALVHDVIIPAGFFAAAGRFYGFEVDTLFVTAILTILGFSVHDTIVVFDRIRENLKREGFSGNFGVLVNQSVRQTFVRSINTSLTVVLALAAVYFFGGATTRIFSLTLIIGIVVGTYSSIFIASPLLVTWHQWASRNQK